MQQISIQNLVLQPNILPLLEILILYEDQSLFGHLLNWMKSLDSSIRWCLQLCNNNEQNLRVSNPLQYSCLENPMDGGAWWAAIYWVAQGRTRLNWLSSSSSSSSSHKSDQQMVRISSHAEIKIFQVKLRYVQRKKASFMNQKFINSSFSYFSLSMSCLKV